MPMNIKDYPKNWKELSKRIRFERAQSLCEGILPAQNPGWISICLAENGKPHPITGSKVVLTVAHLCDCKPKCGNPEHLKALCQRCHLALDLPQHIKHRATNRERKKAQGTMEMKL